MIRVKSTFTVLVGIVLGIITTSAMSQTLSAREVAEKNFDREDGNNIISINTLTLIDGNGGVRTRTVKNYRRDENEVEKSIFVFESPADVKGSAFLSYDWDEAAKEDDSWLYLPALKKTKRIAGGDKSGSFFGSEFSYADFQPLGPEFYDYEMLNESDIADGQDTWVISRVPKKAFNEKVVEETGYLKSKLWIRKDNFMTVKAIIYVKKGRKVKYFQASDIQKKDGIWFAGKVQMVTTRGGKKENASVIATENISFNNKLDDEIFAVQHLARN